MNALSSIRGVNGDGESGFAMQIKRWDCIQGLFALMSDQGLWDCLHPRFHGFSQTERGLCLRGRLTRIVCNVMISRAVLRGSRSDFMMGNRFAGLHDLGGQLRSCSQAVFRLITLCRNAWVRNG